MCHWRRWNVLLQMAAGADPRSACWVNAVRAFTENGKVLLDRAEQESREGSLQDFLRQKIVIERKESLLGLIQEGACLYRSLSVQTIKEAEDLWSRNSHCAALQDALQDFQQLEVQWDSFLQRLDEGLQLSIKSVDGEHQPSRVSTDIALINARTGERTTLGKYMVKDKKTLVVLIRQFSCLLCRLHLKDLHNNQSSLDAHSVQVVVISFGCQDGASHWLQDTGVNYHMLLDSDRQLYSAFGLEVSVRKVLNFRNMLLYAEYIIKQMEFPRGLPSIKDDMFQLGGDFVVDEDGLLLFSHRCLSPIDRPTVENILSAVAQPATSS